MICGVPPTTELSSFAQLLHFQWGTSSAEETVSLRREEDKRAAAIIGATPRHFNTPDCIYRRSKEGEPLYPLDVFDAPHPLEGGLDREIARELEAALLPDDILVCPLGIGKHVDHVITRRAVESLGRETWYYADIPYLLKHPEELPPATHGMRGELHSIPEESLTAWQDGIAAYGSQIKMLFETDESMRTQISGYCQSSRGVFLWRS